MKKFLSNKKNVSLVIFCLSVFLFFIFFREIVFIFSKEKVCAKIIEQVDILNNNRRYKYIFTVEDKIYINKEPMSFFKDGLSLDSLQKTECIEVIYSPAFPNISKITDSRFIE
jgi:hypothetical protein